MNVIKKRGNGAVHPEDQMMGVFIDEPLCWATWGDLSGGGRGGGGGLGIIGNIPLLGNLPAKMPV